MHGAAVLYIALVPAASVAFAHVPRAPPSTCRTGSTPSRAQRSSNPQCQHPCQRPPETAKRRHGWSLRSSRADSKPLNDLLAVRGGGGGRGGGFISGGGSGGGGGATGDGLEGGALVMGMMAVVGMVWRQYAMLLETKPVVTKALTAAIIASVGDVLAQLFEHRLACRRLQPGQEAPRLQICLWRALAVTIEGLLLTGPGLHYLYTSLESLIPSQGGTFNALAHVAVDEFIFDPFFVLGFFFLCGFLEGRDLRRDILPQIQREYWPALKGGWLVSILFFPLEFATFRCLPLQLRVLVVNLTDVVWTAVVSFFSHLEESSPYSHHASRGPLGILTSSATKV